MFYLVVTSMSGSQVNTYTLTIHRSYLATVSYYDGESLLKTDSFYTGNSFKVSFIPKITGYVFNEWAKKDGTSFDEDVLWKSTELYTVKTPNSYTVHYNAGEGEMYESTAKVNYGENYRLAVPTRIGYTFVGWKNGSQWLTDGEGNSLAAFMQVSDITDTSEWTANDYNLTLKQNIKGGTISGEGKFKYDSRVYVTAKVEEGYNFVGWYDNKDILLSKDAAYNFIMGFDLVLTAKFELAKLTLNYVVNGKVADTETFTLDKPLTEFLKYSTQSNFVGWFSSAKFNVTDTKIKTTEELTLTKNNAYLYGGTYTGAEGQEFTYTNNGCTLSAFRGTATGVEISSTFNGVSVTSIGSNAFSGCSSLVSIEIPSSVTSIGSNAFYNCSSLTKVEISDLAAWCGIGFGNYNANPLYYAKHLYLNGEKVTELVIPEGVTSISSDAFSWCSSLVSVEIPSSVTRIGSNAFSYCSGLESITIPFVGETKDGTSNTHFGYIFGANSYSNHSTYVPKSLKTVIITGGTSIGSNAFYNCNSLVRIEIPSSVTRISSNAFSYCSGLESITIPFVGETKDGTSNTHFGYIFGANRYSDNSTYVPTTLKTVIITGGTSIGNSAFYWCSSLVSIEIPSSVTSISYDAFLGCNSLTKVEISDIAAWCGIEFGNNSSNPLTYAKHLYLNGEKVTELVIPEGVTSISPYAFRGCSSLVSVVIPSSLTSINEGVFYDCSSLVSVEIPSSVTSIGSSVFSYCSSLVSIEILDSVTSIGASAFYNCSSLTKVEISDLAAWCGIEFGSYDANPLTYAKHLYLNGEKVTELVIPEGVTSIGASAFSGGSSLVSIEIPNSVTSIGNSAFSDCSSLVSVVIPFGVTSIGNSAFSDCRSLVSVEIPNSVKSIGSGVFRDCRSLVSIEIPSSVTSIGSSAFSGCRSLVSVEIPSSVTSIGSWAFSNCSSLESITIPFVGETKDGTSNTHFGYIFGASRYFDQSTYVPKTLKTVIITGVTSIGESAFYNCSSLVNIVIPSSVTSIGSNAFSGCSGLTKVEISDIAAWCRIGFGNNSSNPLTYAKHLYLNGEKVTELVIPEGVTHIRSYAFSGCSSLVSIVIPSGVTSIDSSAFSGCSGLTIYAEASAKPSGWDSSWNSSCPVLWDYKNNDVAHDGFIYTVQNGIRYGIKDGVATVVRQPRNITTANIPSKIVYKDKTYNVTSIVSYAFYNGSSLVSIVIPSSVTSIGYAAFSNCSSLESITIPFVGATKNGTSNTHFGYIFGADRYIDHSTYVPKTIKTVIITGGTSIGDYAFYNCSSLVSVEIPSSVTSIGTAAFWGCSSLVSIEIPSSVTRIGSNAFARTGIWNNTADNSVVYADKWAVGYKGNVTNIALRADTVGIGDYAFSGCSSLISIEIPNSVTSIGSEAFYGCSGLVNIEYGGTKAEWKDKITKGSNWNDYTGNYTVTCTDGTLSK